MPRLSDVYLPASGRDRALAAGLGLLAVGWLASAVVWVRGNTAGHAVVFFGFWLAQILARGPRARLRNERRDRRRAYQQDVAAGARRGEVTPDEPTT